MPSPFLSSEEYDERAHLLYNEGSYDEALETLSEGLALYPNAVELHVGVGYARLAREEYAWARRSFEEALVLDPDHEDALAGFGETLMKFGQPDAAVKLFHRILDLGYHDDVELMMQAGRALFREGLVEEAQTFFDIAVRQVPDNAEAVAMTAYVQHRLGGDDDAVSTLRRALEIDPDLAEARIYLGNMLYDRGEYEAALYHLGRTTPEDHWDELGIWRLIELRKSTYRLGDDDPSLEAWEERLGELAAELDPLDEMLGEIERSANGAAERQVRGQLELFGAMLVDLTSQQRDATAHEVVGRDGCRYDGSWEEVVGKMRDASAQATKSVEEFMQSEARRGFSLTGILISTTDAESFVRGSADAGLLRILH